MTRKEFEQFVGERRLQEDFLRYGKKDCDPTMRGRYFSPQVQLAWEVLQEAKRRGKGGGK